MNKEGILAEIRRTAAENGGKALGRDRFVKVTGIKLYDWARYWARWSDAIKEAGLTPNTLMASYDDNYLLEKLAALAQELGKFPTHNERQLRSLNDPTFPNTSTFQRLGTKRQVLTKLKAFCESNSAYGSIVPLLDDELAATVETATSDNEQDSKEVTYGYVYLFKSGRYYKIGMTKDTVRRGAELRIQLPERMDLIHSIQTDDPSGVESYWHRRFDAKRMNGEWFDLSHDDIATFRRWRKIF